MKPAFEFSFLQCLQREGMLREQSGQGKNDEEKKHLLPVLTGIPEDSGGRREVFE